MRNILRFSPTYRALAIFAGCAALAFTQTRPPGEQAPPSKVIRVETELVNVFCTVRDRSGAYIANLSQDDFTIIEDGRPQPITHFARQTDQALTVALLFDVSFSMKTSLSVETDDARQFLRSTLRPSDRATLGGFAAAVGLWQTVTSSPQELEQALDHVPELGDKLRRDSMSVEDRRPVQGGVMLTLGGDGGSRLYDAVEMASTEQLSHLPGRKAIIALTDGEDEGSQRTLKEAARSAQQADAIFFGIDPKDPAGIGMYNLKELSSQTGGSAFHIDKYTSLDAALRAIEEQLRNQYAIGYAPPDGSNKGTFHRIQVRVNKPGFKILVRDGYFR